MHLLRSLVAAALAVICAGSCLGMGSGPHPNVPIGIPPAPKISPDAMMQAPQSVPGLSAGAAIMLLVALVCVSLLMGVVRKSAMAKSL